MPAARPAARTKRPALSSSSLALVGALLLSCCLGRSSGFGLLASYTLPSPSLASRAEAGAARAERAGFGRRAPASAASALQSRHGGAFHHSSCNSMARRHSTSLQEAGGGSSGDDDGTGGGGGVLLHAFTLIGKSTRWTVAGLVGAVLLWRRCVIMGLCVMVCGCVA